MATQPANILVGHEGVLKIADLGVAGLLHMGSSKLQVRSCRVGGWGWAGSGQHDSVGSVAMRAHRWLGLGEEGTATAAATAAMMASCTGCA